jgi:hypothetical protein
MDQGDPDAALAVRHCLERWAQLVAAVRQSPNDPRTLADWARIVNISVPTLRAWCYLAQVPPKRSLAMARLLRAVTLAPLMQCLPGDLLDVRDPRTLHGMLVNGGLWPSNHEVVSPRAFCEKQRFVLAPEPRLRLMRLLSTPATERDRTTGAR